MAKSAEYQVGTSFVKKFNGYGYWEGEITSFDGAQYKVVYPADGYEEEYDLVGMDKLMEKSDKLRLKKVTVATRETGLIEKKVKVVKLETAERDGSIPFQKGQQVWVVQGKRPYPATVDSIFNESVNNLPTMARVRWSPHVNDIVEVKLESLQPMHEKRMYGEVVASAYSKRKRKKTIPYAPPVHFVARRLKEEVDLVGFTGVKEAETTEDEKANKKILPDANGKTIRSPEECRPQAKKKPRKQPKGNGQKGTSSSKRESALRGWETRRKRVSSSELLDESENMTLSEIQSDYNSLWDYYLKPITRENEELPSGMILRKKKLTCNLLRFRNSVFRRKAHLKILRLDKQGKRDEIHRILKAIHEHDKSMQSGDGPSQLLEEILGKDTRNANEVEFIDSTERGINKFQHNSKHPIDLASEEYNNHNSNNGRTSQEKNLCQVDISAEEDQSLEQANFYHQHVRQVREELAAEAEEPTTDHSDDSSSTLFYDSFASLNDFCDSPSSGDVACKSGQMPNALQHIPHGRTQDSGRGNVVAAGYGENLLLDTNDAAIAFKTDGQCQTVPQSGHQQRSVRSTKLTANACAGKGTNDWVEKHVRNTCAEVEVATGGSGKVPVAKQNVIDLCDDDSLDMLSGTTERGQKLYDQHFGGGQSSSKESPIDLTEESSQETSRQSDVIDLCDNENFVSATDTTNEVIVLD